MKYFVDTEFSERGPKHPIELISIGIKAEDGRKFYAVSTEFDKDACNDWVKANVLPNLYTFRGTWHEGPIAFIAQKIREFIGDDKPEFWGYYCDYDWVVLCQLFGTMIDLPEGWPMYCNDLKQLAFERGNPMLPKQESTEHNAFNDAEWNELAYNYVIGLPNEDATMLEKLKNVSCERYNWSPEGMAAHMAGDFVPWIRLYRVFKGLDPYAK